MSAPDRVSSTTNDGVMRRLLFVLPVLAFLGLLFFFFSGLQRDPTALPSAMIDKPVPAFDLPALLPDRPALASADLGKGSGVVLVNFFASWCVPCRVEHPILAGLAASGQVQIDGIVYKDKPEAATKFLAEGGNPYSRIGVDASGRTAIDFGVYGVPETYIVDKAGRIRYRHAGPLTDEVLRQEVLPRIQALQAQ